MDTISGAGLARELGTSVPRIGRAIERLHIDARQPNGRLAFTRDQADRIRRALGVTQEIDGLTRSETIALAALRNAPFGLVSARAVARRSGLSPTASARALSSLLTKGLVLRTGETVAAGRAREIEIWRANITHPRWHRIDPILDQVESAQKPESAANRVPRHLRHLFWNTADSQLDVNRSGAYIARRLLQTMDIQGLAWGVQALDPEDWRKGAKARGLDSKVRQTRTQPNESTPMSTEIRMPEHVRRILPADTAKAWTTLAPHMPEELYLEGGTAVAVHLGHRESRDLDFFFHENVDLNRLKGSIAKLGIFAVTHESKGTLKGLFGATKIEVFDASALKRLAKPTSVAGLDVASLQDLMAMKVKVMAERGEMRDYFDVKAIDEVGGLSVEEGVELYIERYGVSPSSAAIIHLYKAMGDLNDVEVDEALPVGKPELQAWWSARQVQVLRNSNRFG